MIAGGHRPPYNCCLEFTRDLTLKAKPVGETPKKEEKMSGTGVSPVRPQAKSCGYLYSS